MGQGFLVTSRLLHAVAKWARGVTKRERKNRHIRWYNKPCFEATYITQLQGRGRSGVGGQCWTVNKIISSIWYGAHDPTSQRRDLRVRLKREKNLNY